MQSPIAITDTSRPLMSVSKLVDSDKHITCKKTHKTFALQPDNEVFLLPAESRSVNSVATLSPLDVDDHSGVHVKGSEPACKKHSLNHHLRLKLPNMSSRTSLSSHCTQGRA